jgi:hypothetical protein
MENSMFLTLFTVALAAAWLAFVLVAFCPLRAIRRRNEVAGYEEN